MARIDAFIEELYRLRGEGLTVASGRPVTVRAEDRDHRLTNHEPTREQVEDLLREMLPEGRGGAGAGAEGPAGGRYEFSYESPAGAVTVRAYRTDSATRLLCVPAGAGDGGDDPEPVENGASEAGDTPGSDGRRPPGPAGGNDAGPGAPEPTPPPGDAPPGKDDETPGRASAPSGQQDATAVPSDGSGPEPREPEFRLEPGDPAIHRLFLRMVEHDCSDLHVSAGRVPLFRKDGDITDLGGEDPMDAEATRALLMEITPERCRREFDERSDVDFAYEIPGVARFRCNLFRDLNGVGGVFRLIPSEILTAEQIGLPEPVLELCSLHKGLVVVTGPTGSGKSTTLAAMIDHINRNRAAHIITVEDPVEFVHPVHRCLINQREVGVHTRSFKSALRAALREDPDIVLVGEMRDLETVEIALETAETGHLVFGTLHTTTAASTVDRIIDQFPSHQQEQIRVMLSESLKGVIAQNLLKRKGGGRVAAMEILLVNPAITNLIRESKTFQIPSVMQTGKKSGMTTLNDELLKLVRDGVVEPEEARSKAVAKSEFKALLERSRDREGIGTPSTSPP